MVKELEGTWEVVVTSFMWRWLNLFGDIKVILGGGRNFNVLRHGKGKVWGWFKVRTHDTDNLKLRPLFELEYNHRKNGKRARRIIDYIQPTCDPNVWYGEFTYKGRFVFDFEIHRL